MRSQDKGRAQELSDALDRFMKQKNPLLGITSSVAKATLIDQLLDSIHRVRYFEVIRIRNWSSGFADPSNNLFDPLIAAIIHHKNDNTDEAFWLIFLSIHFGKNKKAGWRYVRDVYGRLGEGIFWDWPNICSDTNGFKAWLDRYNGELMSHDGPHGFSNHRKFQSLDAFSTRGTGNAIDTYIEWVGPTKSHRNLIEDAYRLSHNNHNETFDYLYKSMKKIATFGRLARFDYLTTVGNLGLASIEPGFAYLQNSTGPLSGARLLVGGSKTANISSTALEKTLIDVDVYLGVGMQVMEDALCNWQKSPELFIKFRG